MSELIMKALPIAAATVWFAIILFAREPSTSISDTKPLHKSILELLLDIAIFPIIGFTVMALIAISVIILMLLLGTGGILGAANP